MKRILLFLLLAVVCASAQTTTPRVGCTLPSVGDAVWATPLNTCFGKLDSAVPYPRAPYTPQFRRFRSVAPSADTATTHISASNETPVLDGAYVSSGDGSTAIKATATTQQGGFHTRAIKTVLGTNWHYSVAVSLFSTDTTKNWIDIGLSTANTGAMVAVRLGFKVQDGQNLLCYKNDGTTVNAGVASDALAHVYEVSEYRTARYEYNAQQVFDLNFTYYYDGTQVCTDSIQHLQDFNIANNTLYFWLQQKTTDAATNGRISFYHWQMSEELFLPNAW